MKKYITNKELHCELVVACAKGQLTPKLLNYFQLLVRGVSSKLTYINPEDRRDCESEAMYKLLLYWKNYNPEITNNAFAYLTEITKRGLAWGFNKIHKRNSDGDYFEIISFVKIYEDGKINI